jgi:CheY-like chemotaxis protein
VSARVLIVDDLAVNVKLLTALLTSGGYAVRSTDSAEAALEILPVEKFALLLLDVRLPGMDGLTLARTIRANPAWAEMVIVAVTANAMKTDEENALAAGCDAFVTKPINTRTLLPRIAELIAKGRAR